jgi:PilZ domain-containing protein
VGSRKGLRVHCKCPVSFSSDETDAEGIVYSLSLGGCAIESSAFVGEGGHISLNIDLGDGAERLSVDLAKIQWLTRREFGVEFLIFKDDGEARLTRFLARSHVH